MSKMKNSIYTIALFLLYFHGGALQAQVMGINTENPTRAVDVNGNARITEGEDKPDLVGVTHMLVADADGNIEKSPIPVVPLPDQSVEVFSRVVILGGTNTPSDSQLPDLQVGGFVFGINNSGAPTFRKASGGNTTFTYGVKILDRRNSGTGSTANNALEYGHSAGSGDGRIYFRNYSKSVGTTAVTIIENITSGTFDTFQITDPNTGASTGLNIPKNRTNTLRRRDNIRLHLVHPDEANYFYKVTYMRQQNSGIPLGIAANGYSAPIPDKDSWDIPGSVNQPDIWVITVERYNNLHN